MAATEPERFSPEDVPYLACPRCERVVAKARYLGGLTCVDCWDRDRVAVPMNLLMLPIGPPMSGRAWAPARAHAIAA
jgi:hypothetical protein